MSIKTRVLSSNALPFWFAMTSPVIGLPAGVPYGVAVGPLLKSLRSQCTLIRMNGGVSLIVRKAA